MDRNIDISIIHVAKESAPELNLLSKLKRASYGVILSPFYWILAHAYRAPGLRFNIIIGLLGLRLLSSTRNRLPFRVIFRLLSFPLDSVRYFEFDTLWNWINLAPLGRYLDVSSPRLFPALILAKHKRSSGILLNPDFKDLQSTYALSHAMGISYRSLSVRSLIEEAPFSNMSIDTISCMSVLEHIANDTAAVTSMWELLVSGGRLLITVPCAREASEELINKDIYGVQERRGDGLWFWQRFYDEKLLEERIYSVIGQPNRVSVFGEKTPGTIRENAFRKRVDHLYPLWREPYFVGKQFTTYGSITNLPGQGVVALEFIRN